MRLVNSFEGHTDYVHCVEVRQNGQVVTGSEDGTVRLWGMMMWVCHWQGSSYAFWFALPFMPWQVLSHTMPAVDPCAELRVAYYLSCREVLNAMGVHWRRQGLPQRLPTATYCLQTGAHSNV